MRGTAPEHIHPAPIQRVAVILFVLRIGPVPDSRRLIRLHAGPADFRVQQAGHGQGIVANELGVELQPRAAGEQPIVRVPFKLVGRNDGRLAVRRAGNDETNERFHVPGSAGPAPVAELAGEPIEQFGMTRPFAL